MRPAAFVRFNFRLNFVFLLGLLLLAGAPSRLAAVELKPFGIEGPRIDVHGFASQGYLKSSEYNYLGDSSKGTTDFNEVGLNASFNPLARTRVAAQVFSYDVGSVGENDLLLDYGFVEYTFNDRLAFRIGRVRRPEGLYNDIQDVDVARTWVLLPQGLYNARWRDFYVSVDGIQAFGAQSLGRAGSLAYDFYYGSQHPKLNGGLAAQRANNPPFLPITRFNTPMMTGAQLWWSPPVAGLRVGVAINRVQNVTYRTTDGSHFQLSPLTHRYSLEYVCNAWTFQAEYMRFDMLYLVTSGGPVPFTFTFPIEPEGWFVSAARRLNRWFEVGAYYTEYYGNRHDRHGLTQAQPSDAENKDATLSFRFDVSDHWTFKVEEHFIRGTGQLYDVVNNPVRRGDAWRMLAVKSTFSF